MARTGRKQLSVQIKESSFKRFEEIKAETGLSQARLIEMLIENYNASNSTMTNTINSTKPSIDEESILAKVDEKLARFTDISTVLKLIENELRDRGLIGIDYSECYDSPLPEDPSLAHLDEYNKPISQEELLKMIEDMEE